MINNQNNRKYGTKSYFLFFLINCYNKWLSENWNPSSRHKRDQIMSLNYKAFSGNNSNLNNIKVV